MDPEFFLPESTPRDRMRCGQDSAGRDETGRATTGPARTGTESLRISDNAGILAKVLPHEVVVLSFWAAAARNSAENSVRSGKWGRNFSLSGAIVRLEPFRRSWGSA